MMAVRKLWKTLAGRECAVRHWIYFYGLRWLLALLILPGLARLQGQGGPKASPPVLEVRWISDSSYGTLASAHIELTARYEIRDVNMLKWVDGSLGKSEGSFEGRKAVYEYVSPAAQWGNGSAEALASLLQEAGEIRATGDGSAVIELKVLPSMQGVSGPYEEATGCYGSRPRRVITLSNDDVQNLSKGTISLKAPVKHDPPECTETSTVEITMPTIELKYDETSADVAQLRYACGQAIDAHIFVMLNTDENDLQKGTWLPHANFAGEVWLSGNNKVQINTTKPPCDRSATHPVTSEYRIHRVARSWSMDGLGHWVLPKDEKSQAIVPSWHDPDNGDFRDDQNWTQDWIDNAAGAAARPLDQWANKAGTLDEFLVEVQDRPECGCIYVAFAMETMRNPQKSNWTAAYRIKYSKPEVIDKEEWNRRKKIDKPNVNLNFKGDEDWVYLGKANGEWKVLK
jgi:hypothetical protein